jgi:CHASE3 domain sensor protein
LPVKFFGQNRILIGFVIGMVIVIGATLATYSTVEQYQQTINTLNNEKAIEDTAGSLFQELLDAEAGQRGYIITGNSSYLEPYHSALRSINVTDSQLKNLTKSDAILASNYSQLQPIIDARLSEMNHTLVVREQQGFAAAQALVLTGNGKLYMDEIRGIIGGMSNYVLVQEINTQDSANQLAAQRIYGVYFWATLGSGIIVYSIYAQRRELLKEHAAVAREQAALERETRNRRRAELLQDILAHDVRNYNQVTRMTAELIGEISVSDPYLKKLIDELLSSIDRSTALVDKAQKIGKVLSEEKANLHPVELMKTIDDSLDLIRNANIKQGKMITDEKRFGTDSASAKIMDARVLADNLLSSVFENIYSNAVRHTDSDSVWIETAIEEDPPYWKIAISDRGQGIEDSRKRGIFTRYLDSRKGSGLGLSIAHALVVDRYNGKIEIKNRVNDDYRKGTTVEIWLLGALVDKKLGVGKTEKISLSH